MPSSAAYSCFENVLWRIRKTHCAEAEFGSVNKIFFTAADHFVRVRSYDDHHRSFPFLIKRFDADQLPSLAHHLFLMLKVDRAPEPCTQQPDIGLIAEQVFLLCFCFCFFLFFFFFILSVFIFSVEAIGFYQVSLTRQSKRYVWWHCFFVEKHSMEWHFYFGLTSSFFTVILLFWFIKVVGELFNNFSRFLQNDLCLS